MADLSDLLYELHATGGDAVFLAACLVGGLILSLWLIPLMTDWMVNAAAGLAGKYLGRSYRTLVINASTNNPELFSMVVAFMIGRLGGVANPLGSNFANIYLMYLVAPLWIFVRYTLSGKREQSRSLSGILRREKKLVCWHVFVALGLFSLSTLAYYLLMGKLQFSADESLPSTEARPLILASGACLVGVVMYLIVEYRLKQKRPELFENIQDEHHNPSVIQFAAGTLGLIGCCYVLNVAFAVCSDLYGDELKGVLGESVFTGLHYFLGALVTSLPELYVAIANFRRLTSPDLNTALASASASNMTNLAIAGIGFLIAAVMIGMGKTFL